MKFILLFATMLMGATVFADSELYKFTATMDLAYVVNAKPPEPVFAKVPLEIRYLYDSRYPIDNDDKCRILIADLTLPCKFSKRGREGEKITVPHCAWWVFFSKLKSDGILSESYLSALQERIYPFLNPEQNIFSWRKFDYVRNPHDPLAPSMNSIGYSKESDFVITVTPTSLPEKY